MVASSGRRNFKMAFNSLCAYASVNHLHWHMYYLTQVIRFGPISGSYLSNIRVRKTICLFNFIWYKLCLVWDWNLLGFEVIDYCSREWTQELELMSNQLQEFYHTGLSTFSWASTSPKTNWWMSWTESGLSRTWICFSSKMLWSFSFYPFF